MGVVIAIHSKEQWAALMAEANSSKQLVVIDFTATWSGPCRYMAPILADLAKKHPNVVFLKVDVDELQLLAEEFSVGPVPTFLLMKEGEVQDKVVGAAKDELINKVEKLQ